MNQMEFALVRFIVDVANAGKVVARLCDGDKDYMTVGTARHLCDKDGNFDFTSDVLDLYLHVSGTFDFYWPVRELMEDIRKGWFCEYTPPR